MFNNNRRGGEIDLDEMEDRISNLEHRMQVVENSQKTMLSQKRARSPSPQPPLIDRKTSDGPKQTKISTSQDFGVHVSRIPQKTTLDDLRKDFSKFGPISHVQNHPRLDWVNIFFKDKNTCQACLDAEYLEYYVCPFVRKERF